MNIANPSEGNPFDEIAEAARTGSPIDLTGHFDAVAEAARTGDPDPAAQGGGSPGPGLVALATPTASAPATPTADDLAAARAQAQAATARAAQAQGRVRTTQANLATKGAAVQRSAANIRNQRAAAIASIGANRTALDGFAGPRGTKIAGIQADLDGDADQLRDLGEMVGDDDPQDAAALGAAQTGYGTDVDDLNDLIRDTRSQIQAKIGRVQGAIDAFKRDDALRVAAHNALVADLNAAARRAQSSLADYRSSVAGANSAVASYNRLQNGPAGVAARVRQLRDHYQNVATHALPGEGDAEASRAVAYYQGLLNALPQSPALVPLVRQRLANPGANPALDAQIAQMAPGSTLGAYRAAINPPPMPKLPDFGTLTSRPAPRAVAPSLDLAGGIGTATAALVPPFGAPPARPAGPVDFSALLADSARAIEAHQARQVANLQGLSFDPAQFEVHVQHGIRTLITNEENTVAPDPQNAVSRRPVIEGQGLPGGLTLEQMETLRDHPYREISTEEAAVPLAKALGLPPGEARNLLNPRSAASAELRRAIGRGGGAGVPANPYAVAMGQGEAPFVASIVATDPGIAQATNWGLLGRGAMAALQPMETLKKANGDHRRPDEIPVGERVLDTVLDNALFMGLTGGAGSIGSAIEGTAGAQALRGALAETAISQLGRGALDAFAQTPAGSALASGLSRAGASALGRAGGRALGFVADNVATQSLPILGQASDLSAQTGRPLGESLGTVGGETLRSLGRSFDPRIYADPSVSLDEKIGAGLQQALLLGGLGLKGVDLVRSASTDSRINPQLVEMIARMEDERAKQSAISAPQRSSSESIAGSLISTNRPSDIDTMTSVEEPRIDSFGTARRRATTRWSAGPRQKAFERNFVGAALDQGLSPAVASTSLNRLREMADRWASLGGERDHFYELAKTHFGFTTRSQDFVARTNSGGREVLARDVEGLNVPVLNSHMARSTKNGALERGLASFKAARDGAPNRKTKNPKAPDIPYEFRWLADPLTPAETDDMGNIYLSEYLRNDPDKIALNLRHEAVHRFFTPAPRPHPKYMSTRAKIGKWFYNNSMFVKALEEGIAEGYAHGSIWEGMKYPFTKKNAEYYGTHLGMVGIEGAAYASALAPLLALGYRGGTSLAQSLYSNDGEDQSSRRSK